MDMEGSAPEETSFQFMSPRVLEIASKQEHAQYFEDVGLSGFCSRVSGENQRHSSADMSELIDNFDKVRGESKVKGIVVSFSVESVNAMFGLEDGRPAADKKGTKYVPTTFSPSKKGKNSGAYKLKGCTDELVKERLEFQLVALYLKGTRVESAASYQIEQVEGCLRADWGKCLTSRLVELLSKSQSSTGEKKRKPTCTFASHLQLILSRAVSPLLSAVQVTPMRAVGQHPSLLSAVQGTAQPVLPAHEASRCTECSEIREEFGVVRALMTEGHAEITTTVGELRKELATVKALYESLAKGVSECGTKQDKGLLAAGAPRDFANLDFNEDATIAGTRPVSSVRENRARNSVSPVRGEDKEDDCKGRRARSLEGRATDKGLGRKSTPSSEAIGPRRDGSGTSMEEDTGCIDDSKAGPAVKPTKLQQQKLRMPCSNVAARNGSNPCEPQPVKRRLDMNMTTGQRRSSQGKTQGKKSRRERRPWAQKETDFLKTLVQRFGEKWAMIAFAGRNTLADRTGGDCKDRWRNLHGGRLP